MTHALDTSISVPYLSEDHEHHTPVASALSGPVCLTAQSLAETYSVLTRLPGAARLSAADAVQLLEANFEAPVGIPGRTLKRLPATLARAGVLGGAVYDALVALAAKEAGMILLTRDARALATYQAIGVKFEIISSATS
jgi:predicted nucleic acid-binding protein